MPGQWYDWTCSACSTEWAERAVGAARSDDIPANREQVVYAIGYPDQINASVGLTNAEGPGAALQRVLRDHAGVEMQQGWLSFDEAYAIYSTTFGLMGGAEFCHWVGVRGVSGSNLWIANSAPGYRGVWDVLSRYDYERLGGFNCLWEPQ
jgi:hypothetical protein